MTGPRTIQRDISGKLLARRSDKFPDIDPVVRAGDFEAAIPLIEALIETDPENAAAWRLLTETRLGLRQFDLAEEAIKRAIQLRPTNPNFVLLHGICLKEMGDFQQAVNLLTKCLYEQPNNAQAHDALKVCHYRLGDEQSALAAGRRKLVLSERMGERRSPFEFEKRPSTGKHIFSFSLWGESPPYCYGAMVNVRLAKIFFPDWLCRFYVSDDVPSPVLEDLNQQGAEVVYGQKTYSSVPRYMWRFLVADDPEVALFACRDTDSRICLKQAAAMRVWIDAPEAFHVMRDHVFHNDLMLAGLWSGIGGSEINMERLVSQFSKAHRNDSRYGVDQFFLAAEIWPRIKHSCLVHDSHYGYPDAIDFPVGGKGDDKQHVGIGVIRWSSIQAELRLFGIEHFL